jgi:branched-chain amino acid transport system permease protein
MPFLLALLVDGALAGTVYALVALAFAVVYKASRIMNFALGDWVVLGARLVGAAFHGLGLGVGGALGIGCAGMIAVAVGVNRVIFRRLVDQPLISLLMVTIGLGAFMRGAAAVGLAGLPARIPLPLPEEPIPIAGLSVAADKLAAAAIALACIAVLGWFFGGSRTGLALRAIADDQQAAMMVGIDLHRHFAITWGLLGVLSVIAGTLWTFIAGGGLGIALVGLKVFPIVILGGLDSIPGCLVGALMVGVLESLAAGYLDPLVGGGFGNIASFLVLLAALFVRPYGLFGRREVERV